MNTKQLHAEIAKKVKKASDSRIWEKASAIVTAHGKKDTRVASSYTTVSYDLVVAVGKSMLRIHKSNYVMGGDYLFINADGRSVFHASERSPSDPDRRSDLEKVRTTTKEPEDKFAPTLIEIDTYIEGDWEQLLDTRLIAQAVDTKRKAEEKTRRERHQREIDARPLTDKETEAAKNFGL